MSFRFLATACSGRAAASAISALLLCAGSASAQHYTSRILTDNICCEESQFDRHLARAWGLEFDPSGFAWVTANFAGRAEVLDSVGRPVGLSVRLEVPPLFNGGFVTGLAFNPGDKFVVQNSADTFAPARVLFVTQEATILGWAPRPAPLTQNTFAPIVINNFARGDSYTGAAVTSSDDGERLCIADFFHKRIVAVDSSFSEVAAGFIDPGLPAGYTPFNIRVLQGRVYVAYALQNGSKDDVVAGRGNGIIDTFTEDGVFESRLITGGALDAPWGMTIAPANFGALSSALLVANVGDGRINAFDPVTGAPRGPLTDSTGAAISLDGLHGIEFGNGLNGQATNTLYFATSPLFGVIGQFGRIDLACPADVTGDGQVSVQDLFTFVQAYFEGGLRADYNGSGNVSVQDLFDFLGGFFGGCG